MPGVSYNPFCLCFSVELQEFISCAAKAVNPCFPSMSQPYMELALQKTLTKELMCDRAGLQSPVPADIEPNTTFCDTTIKAYLMRVNACSDKMLKMWKANRADEGLCR